MFFRTAPPPTYYHTRVVFQRALAFVYFIAFLIAANQFQALAGEHGITPIGRLLKYAEFEDIPSLLWLSPTDTAISVLSWGGVALAVFALSGLSERWGQAVSITTWGLLWLFYLSLVNVGQTFYGFGWEMLLLETGFLAMFLGSRSVRPPAVVMWLILWLAFRIMLGAGLIKLRGDSCWLDCTCMLYHYETQPSPSPLSWFFHHTPAWFHKGEVLFNHFIELVVPIFLFAPRPVRYIAGGLTILFQTILIFSGNLSWLNYLTLILCIPCFDDRFLSRFFRSAPVEAPPISDARKVALALLVLLVTILSYDPVVNLASRNQEMNTSYTSLRLVNTYGAFGGVTRERHEIILEGTDSPTPEAGAIWREYDFKAKPGNPAYAPSFVSPYHYKLDWQMWFAAMRPPGAYDTWFLLFINKLLKNDPGVTSLLANNPYPAAPPKLIRARLYRYHFTRPGEPGWWKRELIREYLPPENVATMSRYGLPQ